MELLFEPVEEDKQILQLAEMANTVWHEHFTSILSIEQIDYMVDRFQSVPALTGQIRQQGYSYFFLVLKGTAIGYTGVRMDEDKLFLSKLYILKDYRKKGYASQTFRFLEDLCREMGKKAIWLTVNRYNADTIAVYKKKGFEVVKTQVADIGNGFVMDDYIMEKKMRFFPKLVENR